MSVSRIWKAPGFVGVLFMTVGCELPEPVAPILEPPPPLASVTSAAPSPPPAPPPLAPDPRTMTTVRGTLREEGVTSIVPDSHVFPVIAAWTDYESMLRFANNDEFDTLAVDDSVENGYLAHIPGFEQQYARLLAMDRYARAAQRTAVAQQLRAVQLQLRNELNTYAQTAFLIQLNTVAPSDAYRPDEQRITLNLTNPGWERGGPGWRVHILVPLDVARTFFSGGNRPGTVTFAVTPGCQGHVTPGCQGQMMQVVSAAWVAFPGPAGFGFLIRAWYQKDFPPSMIGTDSIDLEINSIQKLSVPQP